MKNKNNILGASNAAWWWSVVQYAWALVLDPILSIANNSRFLMLLSMYSMIRRDNVTKVHHRHI